MYLRGTGTGSRRLNNISVQPSEMFFDLLSGSVSQVFDQMFGKVLTRAFRTQKYSFAGSTGTKNKFVQVLQVQKLQFYGSTGRRILKHI